jgi:hypothetical protein
VTAGTGISVRFDVELDEAPGVFAGAEDLARVAAG